MYKLLHKIYVSPHHIINNFITACTSTTMNRTKFLPVELKTIKTWNQKTWYLLWHKSKSEEKKAEKAWDSKSLKTNSQTESKVSSWLSYKKQQSKPQTAQKHLHMRVKWRDLEDNLTKKKVPGVTERRSGGYRKRSRELNTTSCRQTTLIIINNFSLLETKIRFKQIQA